MSFKNNAIFIISLVILGACAPKESITPTWAPEPIDTQLERPFEVSVPIDGLEVEEFGAEFAEVEELGPLFRELAGVFANLSMDDSDGQVVEIEPVIYIAEELDQIDDFSFIKELAIKSVQLNVASADDYELADLSFIKKLNVYLDFVTPSSSDNDRAGKGIPLVSYDRSSDSHLLSCQNLCLNLKIHDVPWIDIIKTQRTFVIYTELVVDEVPATQMELGGNVDLAFRLGIGM